MCGKTVGKGRGALRGNHGGEKLNSASETAYQGTSLEPRAATATSKPIPLDAEREESLDKKGDEGVVDKQ